MYKKIKEKCDYIANIIDVSERINYINTLLNEPILKDKDFAFYPASTKYHGAITGGLFIHSYAVAEVLLYFTDKKICIWEDDRSPVKVGLFHDLCKMDSYVKSNNWTAEKESFEWNKNQNLPIGGHGYKSVIMAQQITHLTDEELMCIRYHMGPYEKDAWDDYDKAIVKYPNVLWTHHADMIAAKIIGY